MIQAAKIIGTGLATTGLIGAGVGIGVKFGALILGVAKSGLLGIIVGIILSIILICLIHALSVRSTFSLQFVLLPILMVLSVVLIFLSAGFLFTSALELVSYVKVLQVVYMSSHYLYMALPGWIAGSAGSENVFAAIAKDRINGILMDKICQKYNIPLVLNAYMRDYFRYQYLEQFDRYINRK